MRRARLIALVVIAYFVTIDVGVALAARPAALPRPGALEAPTPQERVREAYGQLPLAFEENRGQTHPDVKFVARGAGYAMFITGTEAVLVLPSRDARRPAVVRMATVGGSAAPTARGLEILPGKTNYLIGRDRTAWRTGVSSYARVELADVYRGIGMVYYGNGRRLEYDFVVAPGADPRAIRLAFDGADRVWTDTRGDLVLETAAGDLRMHAPVTYQTIGGKRRTIASSYTLSRAADGRTEVGVHVAAWDRRHALVIDPVLSYATYLGGAGTDSVFGITLDGDRNAYLTGNTFSTNFPTHDALQEELFAGSDAFVTKLDPTGTAIVYSTYFGGSGFDEGTAIRTSGDKVYVAGFTSSDDFPVTLTAYQPFRYGGQDAFVLKLGPTGETVEYSTYLGGSANDVANAIAVDNFGVAYVTGSTSSADFPVAGADIAQGVYGGGTDAFVVRLLPDGSDVIWSTFLGGFDLDRGTGIAINGSGVYVVGYTSSIDFPVTPGAPRSSLGGATTQAFVTKLHGGTAAIVYATYHGGNDGETFGTAITANFGKAIIAGSTTSSSLTVTSGAFQATRNGTRDAFVARLNADGTTVQLSTYVGGSGADSATAMGEHDGRMWITGTTTSTDFPGAAGPVATTAAFAAFLTSNGTPKFARLIAGNGPVSGNAVAVDGLGHAFVAGHATASDLATTPGAFQTAHGGGSDGFVMRFALLANLSMRFTSTAPVPAVVRAGNGFSTSYELVNDGDLASVSSTARVFIRAIQPLRLVAVPPVTAGTTGAARTLSVTVPRTQPAGLYRLKMCLDALQVVVEEDETDNCAQSGFFTVVRPDLLVEVASRGTTTSVARGATLVVKTKVRNNGSASSAESVVRFYIGAGPTRSRSDVRLAQTLTMPELGIGVLSSLLSTSVVIPGSLPTGTYVVIACADDRGGIPETDETNNCKATNSLTVK